MSVLEDNSNWRPLLMNNPLKVFLALAALFLTVALAQPQPSQAQLVRVKNDYYVTELRPGKHLIGVAGKKGDKTEKWGAVKGTTKIGGDVRTNKRAGYR